MLGNLINVAVAVNDIHAAVARYERIFGWKLRGEVTESPGLGIRIALLDAGNATIELLSPLANEGALRKFLDTRGEGVYRLAFDAPDVDAALANFDANGVSYVDMSAAGGRGPGNRIVFTHPKAAHGVMIEVVEGSA